MEAEQNPVVEVFQIFGLHGYKDVTIDFPGPTKIIIAENGSGKTTILTALDAFLRSDYSRLYTIEFEKIICKFSGDEEEISLNKSDIASIAKSYSGEAMKQIGQFSDSSANELYEFITSQYRPEESNAWMRSSIAHDIYISSPFDWGEVRQHFDELKIEIESAYSDELKFVTSRVAKSLAGIDLLYLPTYRRVEKPFNTESPSARRRRIAPFGRASRRQKFAEPRIRYGLDDVQNMLIELSQEIQQRTNSGYRKISREIIDDLLAGGLTEYGGGSPTLPDLDVLKRFFSRVGEISDAHVARIERVYTQDPQSTDSSEASQLLYFLSKLATVVHETYQLESTIEEFADIANAYLQSTSDKKSLVYDPVNMAISVVDSWTGTNLELNDLSSGEKQVVSLIAHLYLEPRNKLVLIDEPELSLSIEWQKRILPDIARSARCKQLLAITHSPFVFDNEMDQLATSLDVKRRRVADE